MMNDECDSVSNRALILKKAVEQSMPAEATECDQTTTKCKNYGRQVGQRKVRNFLFQIFLKTMRCYCTSEGCNAQATYPQGCKILVGLKITPVVLMPWICSYFSQFYFLLFWPRQRFFLLFWPRQMALWEKQRLESLRSCFSLFGKLEYSKNGVSLISSLQVLSSLHFWIIKFILHIEIFRPTGLFKNFYTRTLRYWWLMLMLQFAFF